MRIPFIIDLLLYIPAAISVGYVCFFAIAACIYNRCKREKEEGTNVQAIPSTKFLILIPAYGEDSVILQTAQKALAIDYPKDKMHVVVISDHMGEATNKLLSQLPITLLIADYAESTKAKAMQLAMQKVDFSSDYIVILDADNIVQPEFLKQLHLALNSTQTKNKVVAYQCHRTAKNTNTPTALLDAASEEINNFIFRLGHKAVGMSSALIGSGMCIERQWFVHHIDLIQTAGEDKELERLLLEERKKIAYLPDVMVYDEKVQNKANFSHQRLRWIAAQIYSAIDMGRCFTFSIDYADKFLQQCLIPRSMLIAYVLFMSFLTLSIHWSALFILLCISLCMAVPSPLRNMQMLKALLQLPAHTLAFILNVFKIKGQKKKFHHTEHTS